MKDPGPVAEEVHDTDPDSGRTDRLVAHAQAGEPRAFRDLMDAYRGAFYGLARRYAGNHEDADDILQDAFVKVYRNLGRLERPEAFFPWARRIIVNTALDHIRHRKRIGEVETEPDTPGESGAAVAESGFEPPDRRVERREFFRRLEAAIARLPPRQREVVLLHDVEGFTAQEIAGQLNVPPATVRSNLFYGREKLRAELTDQRHRGPD